MKRTRIEHVLVERGTVGRQVVDSFGAAAEELGLVLPPSSSPDSGLQQPGQGPYRCGRLRPG